jgi:RimJ/RimL family protein N-acetyltransferase
MPGPPFLHGETVTLNALDEDDLPFVQRVINDPEVWQSLGSATPKTMKREEEWYEQVSEDDGDVTLLVCVDGDPVGTVGMHVNETWGTGELGYMVAPEAWGEGYCTDAVRTICRYAFRERRLDKVVAEAYATNPGSQRVLEKVGFQREGVHRQEAFVGGERVDLLHFGLLADEYDAGSD